jgi:predicted acyl esterase
MLISCTGRIKRIRLLGMAMTIALAVSGLAVQGASAQATPQQVSQPKYKMVVDKDVRIPTRDGSYLAADVYHPDAPGQKFPVLMSLSAYQKELQFLPHEAPFTHQERPEPDWWVPRGYILVFVDSRGTGRSPGNADIWSKQEAYDYYDAIEWAGVQSWSTGKVGLCGVSYYAITQWTVASLQPPHLTTIVPWEGWADLYRDSVFQGGIFDQGFYGNWWLDVMGKQLLDRTRSDNAAAMNDNLVYDYMTHPLDGPYWDDVKGRPDISKLTVPFYSAGNWDGWNHHLRGNIEAFEHAPSKNKKLRVHMGGHTYAFYTEEGKMDMLRWYDYWLKGINTGIMDEPPVKLCVRISARECKWRFEDEFPIQRTQYTKFYLSPEPAGGVVKGSLNDVSLSKTAPAAPGRLTYDAGPASSGRGRRGIPGASFVTEPLTEDVEVTGHVNLVMWVSSETDDMDVFAFLRKVNPDGRVDTLSRGILKVSQRKLDPKLSTPYRPYHSHDVEEKLKPGEIVPIQVEIWPTSMVFQKGTRIRLDVLPHDGEHYFATYHLKNNSIYTGGDHASYLLLPIVPPKPGLVTDLGGMRIGGGGEGGAN